MYIFLYLSSDGPKRIPDLWTLPNTFIVFLQISISSDNQILIHTSSAIWKGMDTSLHLTGTVHKEFFSS